MTVGPCETCEYMQEKNGVTLGTKKDGWCRRYPPQVVGQLVVFPLIRDINSPMNSCGEYVKDPKKKPSKSE